LRQIEGGSGRLLRARRLFCSGLLPSRSRSS